MRSRDGANMIVIGVIYIDKVLKSYKKPILMSLSVTIVKGTPPGLKYLQHFAPHNFSSRVNPNTRKTHIGPFCILLV